MSKVKLYRMRTGYETGKVDEIKDDGSSSALSAGLCPTHIGIDLASGPDRTAIRCGACGWCGEPKDINRDEYGMTSCPECKIQWVNGA